MLEGNELVAITLESTGAEVSKLVGDGVGLRDALQEVGERAELTLMEHAGALASKLAELSENIGDGFGPLAERVGSLLQQGLEIAELGAGWLREHPEVVSAAIRLVAFVAFGIEHPEMLLQMMQEQPGAIEEVIHSFSPLIEALS